MRSNSTKHFFNSQSKQIDRLTRYLFVNIQRGPCSKYSLALNQSINQRVESQMPPITILNSIVNPMAIVKSEP